MDNIQTGNCLQNTYHSCLGVDETSCDDDAVAVPLYGSCCPGTVSRSTERDCHCEQPQEQQASIT